MSNIKKLNTNIQSLMKHIYKKNKKQVAKYNDLIHHTYEFDTKTVMTINRRNRWIYNPYVYYSKRSLRNLKKYNLCTKSYAVLTSSYNGMLREEAYKQLSYYNDDFIFYFFFRGLRDNYRALAEFCFLQMDRLFVDNKEEAIMDLIKYVYRDIRYVSNGDLHFELKSKFNVYFRSLDSMLLSRFISKLDSRYEQSILYDILGERKDDQAIIAVKNIKIKNSSLCFSIMNYLKEKLPNNEYTSYVLSRSDYYGDLMKIDLFTERTSIFQNEIRQLALSNIVFLKDCNSLLDKKIESSEMMELYQSTKEKKYLTAVSLISSSTEELRYCMLNGSRRISLFALKSLIELNEATVLDWSLFIENSSTRTLNSVIEYCINKKVIVPDDIIEDIFLKEKSLGVKASRTLQVYSQLLFLLKRLNSVDDKVIISEMDRVRMVKMKTNYLKCSVDLKDKLVKLIREKDSLINSAKEILFYLR